MSTDPLPAALDALIQQWRDRARKHSIDAEYGRMVEADRCAEELEAAIRSSKPEKDLRAEKDQAYTERNHVVAALARLFPSGIRATNIDGWNPEWHGCVYIDLPSGQISYHFHESQAHLFAALPPYLKPWDGHDKAMVHQRLEAVTLRDPQPEKKQ